VTAFTAAVLTYYLPRHQFDVETLDGKKRLHNLAQAAHCAAQGKVGSGFDVAAAVYGTCIYRRFSPSVLDGLGEVSSTAFANRLQALVDDVDGTKWDTETVKGSIKMPADLRLVMCDVDCGSQTVGMVKRVLAWRKENADEAKSLWDSLHMHNTNLATSLTLFSEGTTSVRDIEECFANIRKLIRDMSNKSDVPIEPESQTKLLDACTSLDSVIGGVVPGAGGYDAIALLVTNDKSRGLSELETFLEQKWNAQDHGAMAAGTMGIVRPLGVREEMEGIKIEAGLEYGEWIRP
jgi:phosphomevalonate kinase